jgi:hypothetical protein
MAISKKMEDDKSIMLKGSPVNINKPLRNNSPEENKVS